ncbi:fumarylacetoacetate hydrolase family protein [Sphaerotilus mobilis]|uniref:5-carboxy-2-oxohept-3-enedioate decarboxylase HpaG1 subunit n=1 Tax=Sphaerotilus mobilis TaxID=47994 RepID=A0A4Q7LVK4_9BURK|nr:fumarylacetoacetate hydrolase family protein [Sphaerotilus mobilis]RZS57988.1 5-carboxy-2-oxohept-3-enedioate decarboxylase HpaG1 subunit [Sphaerotilus mobilis]
MDVAPYRLSGVVVAALLNHRPQWQALGDAVHLPPYKAPARAPVLAVRPRNTLTGPGARVAVGAEGVMVGASLAIVIGRAACRVDVAEALAHVAGYTIAVDLSVPHDSHYRPAVRLRARDGSCVIGPAVVPAARIAAPDALTVKVDIGGNTVQATDTADRVRGVAQLIADVSEFMTLQAGDLLLLGEPHGAPVAHAGDDVAVSIEGLGRLSFGLVNDLGSPA